MPEMKTLLLLLMVIVMATLNFKVLENFIAMATRSNFGGLAKMFLLWQR